MTTTIQQTVLDHLPTKKSSSKGWYSFNAVCCHHNGESSDKRGRGGVIVNSDGTVTYHCFNCQYKASYAPGLPLSYKFRKLLGWLNVDDGTIMRLSMEALREKDRQELLGIRAPEVPKEELKVSFKKKPLPVDAMAFIPLLEFYILAGDEKYPTGFCDAVEYVDRRKIDMKKYDMYWTSDTKMKMDKRVIIPFTWKNEIIGFTARTLVDGLNPKYINSVDSGYVFN